MATNPTNGHDDGCACAACDAQRARARRLGELIGVGTGPAAVTSAPAILQPPALAIDEKLGNPHSHGKLERRIVWNLIAHLERAGFMPCELNDGEELTLLTGRHSARARQAMELIFNLDEASLRFVKRGGSFDDRHGVLLVLGNGIDIVSDWNYERSDSDGFNAAMESFDVEAYL